MAVRPLLAEDIAPGTCYRVIISGKELAIFNVDGQFYVTQAECTHRGGPLCEGSLSADVVSCPWHGSQFNVRTGEVVGPPAENPLTTYQVEVRDGVIFIGTSNLAPAVTAE